MIQMKLIGDVGQPLKTGIFYHQYPNNKKEKYLVLF